MKVTKQDIAVKRLQALQWKLDTSDVSNRGEDRALAAAITLMAKGRACPECGSALTLIEKGDNITLHELISENDDFAIEHPVDVTANRYDCAAGHTCFVVDTENVPSKDEDVPSKDDEDDNEEAAS